MTQKFKVGDSVEVIGGSLVGKLGTVDNYIPQAHQGRIFSFEYVVRIWEVREDKQIPSIVSIIEAHLSLLDEAH